MKKFKIMLSVGLVVGSWAANPALANKNTVIHCKDQMTFQYGRVLITETDDKIKILLRGYDSHGRAPANLARDLNLNVDPAGVFLWVGATFEKDRCRIDNSNGVLIGCSSAAEESKVTFYSGTDVDRLSEVASSSPINLVFLLDRKIQTSLGSDGFFDPSNTEIDEENFVSGNLFVTGSGTYRSTVTVNIASDQCE